jgi:two-component system, LytTR family, response regulator
MKSAPETIRTLVVDDERLARDLVARLLLSEPDIEICDIVASGSQAMASIAARRPDLVFIDIRMPGLDGLGVIRSTPDDAAPLFIVVTAFKGHAVEAFDVRAFDYVLKPIDKDRFSRAVRDARVAIFNRRALAAATAIASKDLPLDATAGQAGPAHLRLRAGERIVLAPLATVRYFEARSQYVQVHLADTSYLLSTESLSSLEERADPDAFFRIHRSYLVNLRFIRSVVANPGGGSSVVLEGGQRVAIARRNRRVTERLLLKLAERMDPASADSR